VCETGVTSLIVIVKLSEDCFYKKRVKDLLRRLGCCVIHVFCYD
jgi:hypothetical protein